MSNTHNLVPLPRSEQDIVPGDPFLKEGGVLETVALGALCLGHLLYERIADKLKHEPSNNGELYVVKEQ